MRGQLSLHALAWIGAALANAAAAQPTVPTSVATPARGRAVSSELVMRIDGVPVYAQPFDVAQLKREIDKGQSKRERSVTDMQLRPRPIVTLKSGTRVKADWRDGDWYRVRLDDGRMGWMLRIVDSGISNFSAVAAPAPRVAPPTQPVIASKEETSPLGSVPDDQVSQSRPTGKPLKAEIPPIDPRRVEPPTRLDPRETIPLPDRWRLADQLKLVTPRWLDPYNPNVLKGDRPIFGTSDWFFNLGVVSDTLLELRRIPTGVGPQTSERAQANDVFGRGSQSTFVQNVVLNFALIQGNTTFRPPDYEIRFVPVLNFNVNNVDEVRALRIDPRSGARRQDQHFGVQELFVDKHLRDVSDRYDFDSVRAGIQPFQSDFRGFLFNDVPLGVRLFGTRANNQWQYNIGAFRRIEKDTNSGLNDIGRRLRDDDVFALNLYRQDFPVLGFTLQGTVVHNINREDDRNHFDRNGFLVRPAAIGDMRAHRHRVTYLGVNGDGHFGRVNVSASTYAALGSDTRGALEQQRQDIRAAFAAVEASYDFSWLRTRATVLGASGDKDPFDGKATGFDAIFENPQIAGADTSYWIRQAVPLIGGGGVALSGRNGVLPSLRSSKDQGQSNFVNPGLLLAGIGADADLLPTLRVVGNLNYLRFLNTSSVSVLRNQGTVDREIGTDVSAAIQYRPLFNQNIVLNASMAALVPGRGFKQLYQTDKTQYSVLFNVLLTY
jgi:hypothetical protein